MSFEELQFYDDEASLFAWVDGLRQGPVAKTPKPTRAKKQYKNPILPDGTVKRGRPRKSAATPGTEPETPTKAKGGRARKRKREDGDVSEVAVGASPQPTPTRKRGRLSTQQPRLEPLGSSADVQEIPGEDDISVPETHKRGRPPKGRQSEVVTTNNAPLPTSDDPAAISTAPKRRGRPRKHPPPSGGAQAKTTLAATAGGGPTSSSHSDVIPSVSEQDSPTETLVAIGVNAIGATQQCGDPIIARRSESTQTSRETRHIVNADASPSSCRGTGSRTQLEEDTVYPQGTDCNDQAEPTQPHANPKPTTPPPATPGTPSGHEQSYEVPPAPVETLLQSQALRHPEIPIDPTLLTESNNNCVSVSSGGLARVRISAGRDLLCHLPGNTANSLGDSRDYGLRRKQHGDKTCTVECIDGRAAPSTSQTI